MVDVFISYSRHDAAMVAQLARMVEAEGYKVWWDADLPPHQSYGDVITSKIANARAAIVVWSAASVQSEWVRAEADMARGQKKLIQTSLDTVMPPLPFNQIQYAAIGDWQGEPDHAGWRKVKASLAELCGPREAGDALRPAPAYLPPPTPVQPPAPAARWPLFAGAAVGLIGLSVAAGMYLGQAGGEGEPASPVAEGTAAAVSLAEPVAAVQPVTEHAASYNLDATVEDPDGYSNVRSGPGTSAAIIGRVNVGQRFATYQQAGTWWQVRLGDGTEGFIARRLIRLPGEEIAAAGPDQELSPDSEDAGTTAPAIDPSTLTFPDSDTRLLTPADLAGLGPATLRVARNEIFARRGLRFNDPELRNYFANFRWYRPRTDRVRLNDIERRNIELIRQAEARFGG